MSLIMADPGQLTPGLRLRLPGSGTPPCPTTTKPTTSRMATVTKPMRSWNLVVTRIRITENMMIRAMPIRKNQNHQFPPRFSRDARSAPVPAMVMGTNAMKPNA